MAPEATVTLVGVCALVTLDDRVTAKPPLGASELRVTVPVEEVPPTTVVGASVTLLSVGGVMVSVPVAVLLPWVPVMVAVVELATAVVVTVKVADVDPA